MSTLAQQEIFRPYSGNPILTPETWPYPANAVFNPGAILVDGETVLLVRVEDRRGYSHFNVVRSKDGKTNWIKDKKPTIEPDESLQENLGIEDPRIVFVEGKYLITYVSHYSDDRGAPSHRISLMETQDFDNFYRLGPILFPGDKDASLFPKQFNGRFGIIHRPIIQGKSNMWISFSPDKKHWGDSSLLISTRPGSWDSDRVGLSVPPIETPQGWLIIYHGVRVTASGSIYRIGLALLDLEDPRKVIHRSQEWVLGSSDSFSRQTGDVPGAIFPCGAIWEKGELRLYCGIADKEIDIYIADDMERLLAHQ